MTTLKVSIPDDLMKLVEAQVAEGRYGSADEYVQALLERDERKRRARRALDAKIQEGLDSGPSTPMTREDWDSIERRAVERWEREKAGK
ncbi:MAG: type II toxin-antitoxin system ParD family antitoxin [Paludisphaera borealis]|uniref:type II toxin-antitoxin system ParD family antitoxin n=1 Tax=Paludisphaera borealis TaxID=1387353 RepID=UPI0028478536|nr:type II toxin-antitoxin system ParD family antitoxin [Paludisphaera borealis]MDR3622231.1 type II toxin-antitoxin system ParD family antitoxin [Paludisphaera borealis]